MKENYVAQTQKAYEDAARYERATASLVAKPELTKLTGYLTAGATILDAGCAFGRDSRFLTDLGFNVLGLDMSKSLISRAQELNPDINFTLGDVRDLPLLDNSLDAVWSHATLLHLTDEDIVTALKEFKRILTPDGVIAVSFKRGEGTSDFVEQFSSDESRFFNFQTIESFDLLLEQSGFEKLEAHYMNERERFGADKRDLDWLFAYAKAT